MKKVETKSKQAKGLVRSLNRRAVRDSKSPQVVRKTAAVPEPTVCARCGSIFLRRTWRHDHSLTDEQYEQRHWGFCPACDQVSRQEGQGRVVIRGTSRDKLAVIRRRIENVAERAAKTQPERRIVAIDNLANGDVGLEVLTTSQKLAHRIAHELKKLLKAKVTYSWSDDGSLYASVDTGGAVKPKRSRR